MFNVNHFFRSPCLSVFVIERALLPHGKCHRNPEATMARRISKRTKAELHTALRRRYKNASKEGKGRILDEFVALTGYNRSYAVRLLGSGGSSIGVEQGEGRIDPGRQRRIYDEAVREALVILWEAADRICGKRLKAILPDLIAALERHGHLALDGHVKELLLMVSAATIDRMLAPIRREAKPRKKRRRRPKTREAVPIRTFADWQEPEPGYLEIDFVAHCGGSMSGEAIHTLVATDVCSGWTECVPLLAREQSLVAEALDIVFQRMPFPARGIDSDNDSAFINETLLRFCTARKIEFTRCRARQKNDQAWVEQKNSAVVRRLVGHERFSGLLAGQALARLYQTARLYVNYFQPSFKLLSKKREGAKVARTYDAPATPAERLLRHPAIGEQEMQILRRQREQLDPLELLHCIREGQAALATLSLEGNASSELGKKSLEQFLSLLPDLWRSGEARPTHRRKRAKPHGRTRPDPFGAVWPEVLGWLQCEPEATAKGLFERLQGMRPGEFADGQLRTLQRRVKEWRQIMARELVYGCLDENEEASRAVLVGDAPQPTS